MANLKLTDVEKTYGGTVTVLRDIDLDIKEGELIVFVGPSGCGKSTLLRMIAGLEKITGGTLEIDGHGRQRRAARQRGIAMVFQSYALYPHMTVYDNMAFALKIAGDDKETIDRKVRAAAEKLQLTNFLDRLPKALSGGQRQRVAIGRSIVRDPKVYLFDEPLSNLDAALRVATRIEIAQLKEQMPESTMIYVTHDQVEAMTLATRIVVLAGGGIAQVGAPLTLYEKPASTFVAQFIGSPAMNLLGGKIVGTGDHHAGTAEGGGTITSHYPSQPEDMGASVQVGIRPEDMVATDGDNYAFHGTVDIVEALGEVTQLYFDTPRSDHETNTVIAKLHGIHPDLRGRDVRMTADPSKVHIFKDGVSLLYRDEKVFVPGVQPH
jgi:alpha-glucoside transport system ATP-binding protein